MAQKKKTKKNLKEELVKDEEAEELEIWKETPICKLFVVDSIVVDKDKVLSNIPISKHLGKIFVNKESDVYTYENDFADMRFIIRTDTSGYNNIYKQILLANNWSEPEMVKINGDKFDYINPFIMPDGQTIYFAARCKDDNEGQSYSLYTTTFDSETNTFLEPQRLPYPFNSDANDLIYIEDDVNNIAWLATTRRQPEDKVCIYTISIEQPWEYYNNENYNLQQLKSLASIEKISDTWTSVNEKEEIIKKIKEVNIEDNNTNTTNSIISFIVNNNTVYKSFSDFKKEESKNLYINLIDKETKLKANKRQLKEYRKLYHETSHENKKRLSGIIIDAESKIKELYTEIYKLKKEIRNLEQ